jgi:hypothetical protein
MKLMNAGFAIITQTVEFTWQCLRTLRALQALGLSTIMGLLQNLAFVACRLPLEDWKVSVAVILLFISTRILGCGSWCIIPTVLDASTCPPVLMHMTGQHRSRYCVVQRRGKDLVSEHHWRIRCTCW